MTLEAPHLNDSTLPDDVVVDAELRQRLPGLDEAHLGVHEGQLRYVLMGLQDTRRELETITRGRFRLFEHIKCQAMRLRI